MTKYTPEFLTLVKSLISQKIKAGIPLTTAQYLISIGEDPSTDSQELKKKADEDWNNNINNMSKAFDVKVEKQKSSDWGTRGPIHKEVLTDEEQRIRKIKVSGAYASDLSEETPSQSEQNEKSNTDSFFEVL